MQKPNYQNLWIKAAVMASFWASFEIIIGSFFHNMRIPFSGTILASLGVSIMLSFHYIWNVKGLIWRAGLITALLKAISPSGIIFGPMIGIFTEAVFVEVFVFLLGRNLFSYIIAGGLAVFSALLHKIIMLLVIYGWDLVKVLDSFYDYLVKKAGIENLTAFWLIIVVSSVYFIMGAIGAVFGYIVARKAMKIKNKTIKIDLDNKKVIDGGVEKYNLVFLFSHLILLIAGVFIINEANLWISTSLSLIYVLLVVKYYSKAVFHLKKPKFWLQLLLITFIASLFFNKFSSGEIFNMDGVVVGYKITLRAAMMIVGFSALSVELKNPFVKNLLYNRGLRNLYWALELAFSSLPEIMKITNPTKSIRQPLVFFPRILNQADNLLKTFADQIHSNIIVITGDTQSGKTAFLRKIQQAIHEKALKQEGFIADSVYENKQIQGHIIKDLSSDEEFRISYREQRDNAEKIGRFYILNEGLEFGRTIIRNCLQSEADVVIVDEVGPLELKGKGWSKEVGELIDQRNKTIVFIVRGKFLEKFTEQYKVNSPYVFYADKDRAKDAVKVVVANS